MEPSRNESSQSEAEGVTSDVKGHELSGIVLVANPVLPTEVAAGLFQAAWGAHAPGSPPAVDHCLAHFGAYDNGRLVGFVKLAWTAAITPSFWTPPCIPSISGVESVGLVRWAAGVAEENGRRVGACRFRASTCGFLCPVRLPSDPCRAVAAEDRVGRFTLAPAHTQYEPEAQASGSQEVIHSLARRARRTRSTLQVELCAIASHTDPFRGRGRPHRGSLPSSMTLT